MAKKLQGATIDHNGWMEFDQAPDEPGPWQKATLVIGDERVFTESEVKAMMRSITHCTGSPVASIHINEVRRVFQEEHGIVLDPPQRTELAAVRPCGRSWSGRIEASGCWR